MADVAVVVIHGMGTQAADFAEPTIDEVSRRLSRSGVDPTRVAWQPIYWADILDGRELAYLRAARNRGDLDYMRLRKFVVTALGDAVAYQQVPSPFNTTYGDLHARVGDRIHDLYVNALGGKPKPLIILAHSLGGHIMSNYIWDAQTCHDPTKPPFERMEWTSGIVTFGCNIPLFTFAYQVVQPIRFPPPRLKEELKQKAKWLNYYDPDDVLGYPLKPISPEYAKVVTADHAINAGGVFSSWNPLSHQGYWTDNNFTKPVAKFLASFL